MAGISHIDTASTGRFSLACFSPFPVPDVFCCPYKNLYKLSTFDYDFTLVNP